ncbi:hypothetical protein H4R18_000646 [Coemansia javaensis]|uniref:Uncharacterized protein n=1 Tax=Coemansia javaensis TaxID=2761396 RepID=A0A9W8LLS9_9FUNG|nr:hypothetical protein H4R18_000646 [Coemansia javaensis]
MGHGTVACHSAALPHDQLVRRAVANQIIQRAVASQAIQRAAASQATQRTRRRHADGAHCHSDGSARRRAKATGAKAAGSGPLAAIAALVAEMAGARPEPHAVAAFDAQVRLVRRIAKLQREKERLLRIIHRAA